VEADVFGIEKFCRQQADKIKALLAEEI